MKVGGAHLGLLENIMRYSANILMMKIMVSLFRYQREKGKKHLIKNFKSIKQKRRVLF